MRYHTIVRNHSKDKYLNPSRYPNELGHYEP
jgi:hypothetical protein